MTTVRTIMNARAKQRKNSLVVQGFKCQEIGHKRYTNLKLSLKTGDLLIKKLEAEETPKDMVLDICYKKQKELKKQIAEYEKKNNINKKPEKVVKEKKGFMSKVRSIFSRRNKVKSVGA